MANMNPPFQSSGDGPDLLTLRTERAFSNFFFFLEFFLLTPEERSSCLAVGLSGCDKQTMYYDEF